MSRDAPSEELARLSANAIRFLAIDAVEKAKSGHPGMPMGMADIATALWGRYLRFNPKNPRWLNRDRFVLSNGHGSMLLYSLLHLTGYDLPMTELQNFRQLNSMTPGHPENTHTPGVEVTTGPLGQGITNAVGFALAERWLAARFNRPGHEIIDHHTYVFAGDGCMMEGVSHEGASLAGHLKLSKLIVFYDNNHISIDGPTKLSYSDDVRSRFTAYGWHIQQVDGHDPEAVAGAIEAAKAENGQPSLIICDTVIGWGSPNKAGSESTHGSALGPEEVEATRKHLNWDWPPFELPQPAIEFWSKVGARGSELESEWNRRLADYAKKFPDEGKELTRIAAGRQATGWQASLAKLAEAWRADQPDLASRQASGKVLEAIAEAHTDLLGGSADLTPSNNTRVKSFSDIAPGDFGGKYVRYGVREHAMGAVMNGLALHGGVVPYGGTFAVFTDYMRPAMRLSAISGVQVIYVLTHDSIGLGEDGPTHQPVEHFAALRAIPNLHVFRPADALETLEAWEAALNRTDGPSALLLSRQTLPALPRNGTEGAARGGYVLADAPDGTKLQAVLMGSGSEVALAMAARDQLAGEKIGCRVVSLPSWELFDAQPESYRNDVLAPQVTCRVAVEAGVELGWAKYLGSTGTFIGMKSFGASAPFKAVYEAMGITADAVVQAVKQGLG